MLGVIFNTKKHALIYQKVNSFNGISNISMYSSKKLNFLFVLAVFFIQYNIYGQNCTQTLRNAQRAYDEGRIAEIPNILNVCLRNGFSRDEKIRAYRLLTLSYLYQYEGNSAEKTMLEFLRVVPDYKLTPEDPAPFAKLYKQFRTWPIFLVGFKLGPNFAQPQGMKGYTPFESNFSKNSSIIGFLFSINGEVFINNKMSLNTGVNFMINRSRRLISGLDSNLNNNAGTENQIILALPISVTYNFYNKNDLIIYGRGGLATNILLNASISNIPTNTIKDANNNTTTVTPPQGLINLNSERRKFNFSLVTGAGLKYKLGKNFLVFDASYWFGLNDVSKDPWDNTHNGANVFNGYTSDSFRVNNMSFTMGLLIPIYKPKLLRKK